MQQRSVVKNMQNRGLYSFPTVPLTSLTKPSFEAARSLQGVKFYYSSTELYESSLAEPTADKKGRRERGTH